MDPFLGAIMPFAFGFAPRGWAQCNGQLLPIAQYQALFSLLGVMYGGDGRTTFALPDLRGRVPIGGGQGAGLPYYDIGEITGSQSVTLSTFSMPQHQHLIRAATETADIGNPTDAYFANTGARDNEYKTTGTRVTMNSQMMTPVGSGAPVSTMQPYTVVNYCISMGGVYPTRD